VYDQTYRRIIQDDKVPADQKLFSIFEEHTNLDETMLDRQEQIYGRYPLKVASDGGFATKSNLASAKDRKIKDVCFAQKRRLKEADMCRSEYVYKNLEDVGDVHWFIGLSDHKTLIPDFRQFFAPLKSPG